MQCAGAGCGKPATLRCPTCIKQNIPNNVSTFCSKECFQGNWVIHKLMHSPEGNVDPKALPSIFSNYRFTGKVRPTMITPRRPVPPEIPRPDYANHPQGRSASEDAEKDYAAPKIHTLEEIEKMRTCCKLAREILDEGARAIKVGVTTDEINRVVHEATIARGGYPSPLNYRNFPKSVCTSVNEVICHGIPDLRELQNGDIVNIDVSLYFDGFHGDLNETYFVGEVDEESKRLVRASKNSLDEAIKIIKPGTLYRQVGDVISQHIEKEKFSVVRSYCGHGINQLFHTVPSIPHYKRNKAIGVMKAGHIFTIEPMINAGKWHDELWPDRWTAVTVDGKRSAQFEHTLLVTETGVEILTARLENSPYSVP